MSTSRLAIPVLGKKLWVTGDVLLRSEIELLVWTSHNAWEPLSFRADSGNEMTTMPAARAKQLGIPYPQAPVPGLRRTTPGGTKPEEFRAGAIKSQVVGMDGTAYWFPCYFQGDPDAPLVPNAPPEPNLLALTGVIDKLRLSFDGTPTLGAPHGNLIVEKL
jgi:hypothetical protein